MTRTVPVWYSRGRMFYEGGLFLWVASIVCGYAIGKIRNRTQDGIVWPLFLGPIGLVVVCCLPSAPSSTLAAPRAPLRLYRVRRGGQEMNSLTSIRIRQLIAAGQLSESDYFFDEAMNDWAQIDLLPE